MTTIREIQIQINPIWFKPMLMYNFTLSRFSNIILLTSDTWAFTFINFSISSACSMIYFMCSLIIGLQNISRSMSLDTELQEIHPSAIKIKLFRVWTYPKSLLRLFATAVSALPPPYLFLKSAFIRSKKAIDICLLRDSFATTQ